MRQTIFTQSSNAEAYITKGKQRIKQLNGNVHLNDGESFEIELFNPNTFNILAKIKINNTLISGGGIVVRPGERVYLERFLDTNKKFVFKTYEVSGTSKQVKKAIESNGNVEIEFFKEQTFEHYWSPTYSSGTAGYYPYVTHTFGGTNLTTRGSITTSSASTNMLYDANVSFTADTPILFTTNCCNTITTKSKSIETGRIGKGKKSNQKLTTVDMDFESYSFKTIEWKILPESQRKLTSRDIKQYCGSCGTRIKKTSYKYCPNCGTEIG